MESAKSNVNTFRIQTSNRKYNGFGNSGKSLGLARKCLAFVLFGSVFISTLTWSFFFYFLLNNKKRKEFKYLSIES